MVSLHAAVPAVAEGKPLCVPRVASSSSSLGSRVMHSSGDAFSLWRSALCTLRLPHCSHIVLGDGREQPAQVVTEYLSLSMPGGGWRRVWKLESGCVSESQVPASLAAIDIIGRGSLKCQPSHPCQFSVMKLECAQRCAVGLSRVVAEISERLESGSGR